VIPMEIAIAMLSGSIPLTAAIIKLVPKRDGGNGKHVSTREYDAFKYDLGDRLERIENGIDDLSSFVRSRFE
jgi:hypothetical protein